MESAFSNENKTGPRLSLAFALVNLGKRDMGEFDPLRYLVNNLNSTAYRGVARAYLTELARDPEVRQALYPALKEAGRHQRREDRPGRSAGGQRRSGFHRAAGSAVAGSGFAKSRKPGCGR